MSVLTQEVLMVTGLVPAADRYNTGQASDVVSMKNYGHLTAVLNEGAGGTGTVKLEVYACDDLVPSNRVAIPFKYKLNTTGDTWGSLVEAAATGYTTIAGANKKVAIEIDARELPQGYPCVQIQSTEVVDSPCVAGLEFMLSKPRYAGDVLPTAIA